LFIALTRLWTSDARLALNRNVSTNFDISAILRFCASAALAWFWLRSARVAMNSEKLPLYCVNLVLWRWTMSVHTTLRNSRACDTTTTVPGHRRR